VFFELIGERGRSGAVVLAAAAPAAFRPGGVDAFTFPLLAPRGDLTWLRVGTDGAGLLPAWHLRCAPAQQPARWRRTAGMSIRNARANAPRDMKGCSLLATLTSASLERRRHAPALPFHAGAQSARAHRRAT